MRSSPGELGACWGNILESPAQGMSFIPCSCRRETGARGEGADFKVFLSKACSTASPSASAGDVRDAGSVSGSGRAPGGGHWQQTPVFLPGESHGQRSLVGYSPWGRKESDTTEVT